MSISYIEEKRQLILETSNTGYYIEIDEHGYLRHLYYGPSAGTDGLNVLHRYYDRGFSGNPYELREDRTFSLDTMPQEYTSCGVGDYRISSIAVTYADGSRCTELKYISSEIIDGKFIIPGLPSVRQGGYSGQTLVVTMADGISGLKVRLYYGVLEEADIITRSAELINEGTEDMWIDKAASVCLDLPSGDWDMMHFHGRHCMERQPERISLFHGIHTVASARGMSGHQHNPFVIMCSRDAGEDHGDCYGIMLMYSGSHRIEAELDQFENVRVVSGINNEGFRWKLAPGASFHTPETILTYADGLTRLSHNYHDVLRSCVIDSRYKSMSRPVAVNNWEATYFDFTEDKLVDIADRAVDLGIDMLVLDDGWFAGRNDDNGGLGDWVTDTRKLPGGLGGLIDKVRSRGLKFGLWIEPEMVSERSELYRAHPDWALKVPGRLPMMGRNQLVLDLSHEKVYTYIRTTIRRLLTEYRIDYIKWDFNRPMSDIYSSSLPPERQGEVMHRYYLNLYRLLEELNNDFPDVMIEGCAGGGGRFDAAMLQYSPQIWCSDNTDPIARLTIQYGTSFGYPCSAISSHVSASPNHQTGRSTPLSTRGVTAMAGVLGYELDLTDLTADECEEIRSQITAYKQTESLIQSGRLYRLSEAGGGGQAVVWEIVSEDRSCAVLSIVVTDPKANADPVHVRLKGLDENYIYSVNGETECTGRALMTAGCTAERMSGDYPACRMVFSRVRQQQSEPVGNTDLHIV